MEAFGLQAPGGRRRVARYGNTKRSGDITSGEQETMPELVALHMEFKIQRERLSAWGNEWKDDRAGGDSSSDESSAQANLAGALTDVLANIKNILDEADQIQSSNTVDFVGSGMNLPGEKLKRRESGGERRWVSTDRSRYEQLAEELKGSIDLLYEISKNRKELRDGNYPSSGKHKSETARQPNLPPVSKSFFLDRDYSISQETLVNPTRSSTAKTTSSLELPPRLDPSALELPEEEPPPYDSIGATPSIRVIARLRQAAPPSASFHEENSTVTLPVLIEYAPFDPTYLSTGVSVPTNRLDAFMNFYARSSSLVDFSAYGTLSCLGYFEDPTQARFGLVYELPQRLLESLSSDSRKIDLRPCSLLKVLQSASKSLNSANRALPPGPPLEDRFRLALNLMQAFNKLHSEERLLHKDVNSSNVMFFTRTAPSTGQAAKHEYDIRTPYMSSFDLFSEYSIEALSAAPDRNLYRHPEDPRIFQGVCQYCNSGSCKCSKYRFDIYGLGLLLLEIGLWIPLSDLFKPKYSLEDFKRRIETIWVKRLSSRCGSIYMNVVRDCLQQSSRNITENELRGHYDKCIRRLQKCCLLDEDDSAIEAALTAATTTNISGAPTTVTPEDTFVVSHMTPQQASAVGQTIMFQPSLASNNPFLALNVAPSTTSSFFSNPFSRFSSSRTSLPYSIKESGEDSLFKSNSLSISGEPGTLQARSDLDNISVSSTSSKYQRAAKTIQRAWRGRCCNTGSFQEYKRKITLLQKQWRSRQLICNSKFSTSSNNVPALTPNIIAAPEIHARTVTDQTQNQVQHIPSKPKLRLHTVKLSADLLDQWHEVMLPRLERLVERALKDSPETVSIDLIGVGETALSAKPTIFITCCSTSRIRSVINRKFSYDNDTFDLRIRRGRVRRSKATRASQRAPAHRSMMNEEYGDEGAPLNPFHQERPLCGASIGAYVGDKHLPPVSFGGVIRVDGEHYGMTVHHLLDSPSDDDSEDEAAGGAERSSARRSDGFDSWLAGIAEHPTLQRVPTDSVFALEISDDEEDLELSSVEDESEYIEEDEYDTSEEESEGESVETGVSQRTEGDLKGIQPGGGSNILVTQPALDDVDEDFFPNEEDKDDDHLDSHKLGHIHASSGIRRWNRNGTKHEIDWALLQLDENRIQPYNLVQGGRKHLTKPNIASRLSARLLEPVCRGVVYQPEDDEYPIKIARSNELSNLRVHCFGRTSGLQGGIISEAMSAVRIYRRRSFSRSWHVVGNFGVGGDSGAWVIDNEQGRVCGHVLAWCERNAVAYICPMEVLLEDIKKTLGAKSVSLPGGESDEEDVILGYAPGQSTARLLNEKSACAEDMELPDIARLDFGDRERLGLGSGAGGGGGLMRSSRMGPVRIAGTYPRFIGTETRQIA
ncbi:hypothetical protein EJ08DRAFT_587448 [Tothia fuscella]|uniref:Protein kinase domain-containing protein n=1 Tax=Tothia fuscella TaxID=1048955 RepID=A0A9P4NTJ2_9PEZI|nr:hypothetical protein EJ08DRAFT_587448 [Tothia fuscella]